MKASKTKFIIRIIVNFLIVACFAGMLIALQPSNRDGALVDIGISAFKYFTTLSNLLEAIASLLWFIVALACRNKQIPRFFEVLKYIATVQVFITFMVVVAFLAPIYGYVATCSGMNFYMHIVIPLASILEQIFLCDTRISMKVNLIAVIPPLVYGIVYIINILINGRGVYPDTNDWYGFLNWGPAIGAVIFICILVLAFLLGLALRGLWKAVNHKALRQA